MANFNVNFISDSSDDESIFITQQTRDDNVNNQAIESLNLEELMNSLKDSVVGSITSLDGSDMESNENEEIPIASRYQTMVEEISDDEE